MATVCYIAYSAGLTFQATLILFHRMYNGPLSTMVKELKFVPIKPTATCKRTVLTISTFN